MMLQTLLDDGAIDSVIFCSIVGLIAMCFFQGVQVIHNPASFSAVQFAAAVGGLIASGGAVKTCRERYGNKPSP